MIKKKNPLGLRAIAGATLFFFAFSTLGWALPEGGLVVALKPETPSAFLQIEIPEDLATVEEVYEAPARQDSKLLLHVQDAHASYEAQVQIKKLLEYLRGKYGFQLFFAEGAIENLNPDYLKLFPEKDRNMQVADYLARRGELTGIEYFLLQSPDQVEAVGIEKAELYRQNYEAFQKVYGKKNEADRELKTYGERLDLLASRIFSPDLRRVLAEWKKFEDGHREFMPYVRQIAQEAKKVLNLDLESLFAQVEWPQITRLLVVQSMESDLNEAQAAKEKGRLVAFLKEKRVSAEVIDAIGKLGEKRVVLNKLDEKQRRLEDVPRYLLERLVEEAGPKGFYFHDYPAFSLQAGFQILQSELDSRVLFEEIDRIFQKILNELAQQEREKNLLELYKDLSLFAKLYHLELTRKEWDRTQYRKDWIRPEAFAGRLEKMTAELGPSLGNTQPLISAQVLEELFPIACSFYDFAQQREAAFYQKIESTMNSRKIEKAILVTGGFHTDGIAQILREKSVNYGVLTPRMSGVIDNTNYASVMMEKHDQVFDVNTLNKIAMLQTPGAQREQGLKNGTPLQIIHAAYTRQLKPGEMDKFMESLIYKSWQKPESAVPVTKTVGSAAPQKVTAITPPVPVKKSAASAARRSEVRDVKDLYSPERVAIDFGVRPGLTLEEALHNYISQADKDQVIGIKIGNEPELLLNSLNDIDEPALSRVLTAKDSKGPEDWTNLRVFFNSPRRSGFRNGTRLQAPVLPAEFLTPAWMGKLNDELVKINKGKPIPAVVINGTFDASEGVYGKQLKSDAEAKLKEIQSLGPDDYVYAVITNKDPGVNQAVYRFLVIKKKDLAGGIHGEKNAYVHPVHRLDIDTLDEKDAPILFMHEFIYRGGYAVPQIRLAVTGLAKKLQGRKLANEYMIPFVKYLSRQYPYYAVTGFAVHPASAYMFQKYFEIGIKDNAEGERVGIIPDSQELEEKIKRSEVRGLAVQIPALLGQITNADEIDMRYVVGGIVGAAILAIIFYETFIRDEKTETLDKLREITKRITENPSNVASRDLGNILFYAAKYGRETDEYSRSVSLAAEEALEAYIGTLPFLSWTFLNNELGDRLDRIVKKVNPDNPLFYSAVAGLTTIVHEMDSRGKRRLVTTYRDKLQAKSERRSEVRTEIGTAAVIQSLALVKRRGLVDWGPGSKVYLEIFQDWYGIYQSSARGGFSRFLSGELKTQKSVKAALESAAKNLNGYKILREKVRGRFIRTNIQVDPDLLELQHVEDLKFIFAHLRKFMSLSAQVLGSAARAEAPVPMLQYKDYLIGFQPGIETSAGFFTNAVSIPFQIRLAGKENEKAPAPVQVIQTGGVLRIQRSEMRAFRPYRSADPADVAKIELALNLMAKTLEQFPDDDISQNLKMLGEQDFPIFIAPWNFSELPNLSLPHTRAPGKVQEVMVTTGKIDNKNELVVLLDRATAMKSLSSILGNLSMMLGATGGYIYANIDTFLSETPEIPPFPVEQYEAFFDQNMRFLERAAKVADSYGDKRIHPDIPVTGREFANDIRVNEMEHQRNLRAKAAEFVLMNNQLLAQQTLYEGTLHIRRPQDASTGKQYISAADHLESPQVNRIFELEPNEEVGIVVYEVKNPGMPEEVRTNIHDQNKFLAGFILSIKPALAALTKHFPPGFARDRRYAHTLSPYVDLTVRYTPNYIYLSINDVGQFRIDRGPDARVDLLDERGWMSLADAMILSDFVAPIYQMLAFYLFINGKDIQKAISGGILTQVLPQELEPLNLVPPANPIIPHEAEEDITNSVIRTLNRRLAESPALLQRYLDQVKRQKLGFFFGRFDGSVSPDPRVREMVKDKVVVGFEFTGQSLDRAIANFDSSRVSTESAYLPSIYALNISRVVEELLAAGFSKAEIQKLNGLNYAQAIGDLRILQERELNHLTEEERLETAIGFVNKLVSSPDFFFDYLGQERQEILPILAKNKKMQGKFRDYIVRLGDILEFMKKTGLFEIFSAMTKSAGNNVFTLNPEEREFVFALVQDLFNKIDKKQADAKEQKEKIQTAIAQVILPELRGNGKQLKKFQTENRKNAEARLLEMGDLISSSIAVRQVFASEKTQISAEAAKRFAAQFPLRSEVRERRVKIGNVGIVKGRIPEQLAQKKGFSPQALNRFLPEAAPEEALPLDLNFNLFTPGGKLMGEINLAAGFSAVEVTAAAAHGVLPVFESVPVRREKTMEFGVKIEETLQPDNVRAMNEAAKAASVLAPSTDFGAVTAVTLDYPGKHILKNIFALQTQRGQYMDLLYAISPDRDIQKARAEFARMQAVVSKAVDLDNRPIGSRFRAEVVPLNRLSEALSKSQRSLSQRSKRSEIRFYGNFVQYFSGSSETQISGMLNDHAHPRARKVIGLVYGPDDSEKVKLNLAGSISAMQISQKPDEIDQKTAQVLADPKSRITRFLREGLLAKFSNLLQDLKALAAAWRSA